MRPPMVRRSSGAPSRGQCRPGPRADVRSPVCEPPRLPRMRSVSRIARCKRLTSSSPRSWAARAGSMPARQRTSSHSRLPRPAIARLVHDHRLHRRPAPGGDGAQLRQGEVEGVGTETVLVGIELDRAEPARIAQEHRAAVGERHPEAVPRGIGLVAGVEKRIAGGFVVDQHAAAHAEVQAEHWPAARDVDEDQLPAHGGRRRTTGRATRRAPVRSEAALQEPRVGCVDLSRSPGPSARALDQRPAPSRPRGSRASQSMKLVIAPRSAPCASRAYLARNPLV